MNSRSWPHVWMARECRCGTLRCSVLLLQLRWARLQYPTGQHHQIDAIAKAPLCCRSVGVNTYLGLSTEEHNAGTTEDRRARYKVCVFCSSNQSELRVGGRGGRHMCHYGISDTVNFGRLHKFVVEISSNNWTWTAEDHPICGWSVFWRDYLTMVWWVTRSVRTVCCVSMSSYLEVCFGLGNKYK